MSFEAVVFRATDYHTPLWPIPNLSDGRFNTAGSFPAQYLSLHPMTPWAELLRNLRLRTLEAAREARLPIWSFRVTLDEAPVEIHFDNVDGYALAPEDLVADDQAATRSLGAALVGLGVKSFIAPSAALPGTTNLVVLDRAVVTDWNLEPIDPEEWPAAMVAQAGRCPENLWDHVHHRDAGVPHAGLQAWLEGDDLVFEQPEVTAETLQPAY